MDLSFWAGIFIAALISVPLSIFANLYSDPVRDFLDRRRTIRLNKKRSREVQTHERIVRIKTGDPTEILRLAEERLLIIVSLIMAVVTFFVLGAMVFAQTVVLLQLPEAVFFACYIAGFVLVCLMIAGFCASLAGFRQRMRKVVRLEDYEAEMRAKWGPDVV